VEEPLTIVLAGDTGGTNTRLALYEAGDAALTPVADAKFGSREHAGLSEIVRAFLSAAPARPERATFGIAGPVRNGRVHATNLPWDVDAADVAAAAGVAKATLLNDLEANAWGLAAIPASDVVTLQAGAPGATGNAALVSAGTGLGEAGLYWDGRAHRPFACEGGHASFAPRSALEIELLEHLAQEFGHVSWERVLSGPGLVNIHAFLRRRAGAPEPKALAEEMRAGDPAAAISRAALSGTDGVASQALDLFVGFYGAEAGNLALKIFATGGVYLGGGIAPKIASRLAGPAFLSAFLDKGRMRPLLETMPVRIVANDQAALLGAAWHAAYAEDSHAR
jgi:glucokinase